MPKTSLFFNSFFSPFSFVVSDNANADEYIDGHTIRCRLLFLILSMYLHLYNTIRYNTIQSVWSFDNATLSIDQ